MPKRQYWAGGADFSYMILAEEPGSDNWSLIEGPFKTLSEAKKQVREWIKGAREDLAEELHNINSLRESDFD